MEVIFLSGGLSPISLSSADSLPKCYLTLFLIELLCPLLQITVCDIKHSSLKKPKKQDKIPSLAVKHHPHLYSEKLEAEENYSQLLW